jgi:hypothetical protein
MDIKPNEFVAMNIGLSMPTFLESKTLSHMQRLALIRKRLPNVMRVVKHRMEIVPRHVYGGEPVLILSGYLKEGWESSLFELLAETEQDCCAMVPYGSLKGKLFGPHADKWGEFNINYFVF